MDIVSLILIVATFAIALCALWLLFILAKYFVAGIGVLHHVASKNGLLGYFFFITAFLFMPPLMLMLAVVLGYRDKRLEEKFWLNVKEGIEAGRNEK